MGGTDATRQAIAAIEAARSANQVAATHPASNHKADVLTAQAVAAVRVALTR